MKKKSTEKIISTLPVLPLSRFVMFPNIILHLDINKKPSIEAANKAMNGNQLIFLVTQKNSEEEIISEKNLYKIGIVAQVKQIIKSRDGTARVMVEGLGRAKVINYSKTNEYLLAEVTPTNEIVYSKNPEYESLLRAAREIFTAYLKFSRKVPKDIAKVLNSCDDAGRLADFIASNMTIEFEKKQKILEESDTAVRLEKILVMILEESEYLKHELELSAKIHSAINKNQREYFLKAQQKIIAEELGEEEDTEAEAIEFETKIKKLKLSEEVEKKLLKECDRLSKYTYWTPDANLIRDYLEECVSLPWNKITKDTIDLEKADKILDSAHFGLKGVKERITEFLAVRKIAPNIKGQIICLAGPPGVGKSSIAKSLAKAMGRKFVRVSLGGIRDESEIRGHRKTYIGAMPGRIISAIKQAKTKNPVILLDEIDKLSKDFKGDPASALLEVLDSEQNQEFRDHYLEIPFDLSNIIFISTANDTNQIPAPLYDRMEIINHYSYTHEEKFSIAKKYLIPKQMKNHGLKSGNLKIEDEVLHKLIEGYTKEAGVRELERKISSIMRKSAKNLIKNGKNKKTIIDNKVLKNMLGSVKFKKDKLEKNSKIGVVNGLAWTTVGGDTMPIEVSSMKGKGKVNITGSLGNVMKESAQIAVSYIRSNAKKLGIDENFYKNTDIHIHAPEGSIPKDGPSAGVTMTTALVSELGHIPVRQNVAMTGEITLKGRVLPIGGLKEKTMAAYRAGIKTVIIPKNNEHDLQKIDEIVKNNINFVLAENIEKVFETALENKIQKQKICIPESKKSLEKQPEIKETFKEFENADIKLPVFFGD